MRNPEAWGAVEGVEFKKDEELPVGVKPGLKLEGREYLQLSLNGAFTDSAAKLKCTGGISVCGFWQKQCSVCFKPWKTAKNLGPSEKCAGNCIDLNRAPCHETFRVTPPQRIFKLLKEALAKKAQEIKVKNEDRRADDEIGEGELLEIGSVDELLVQLALSKDVSPLSISRSVARELIAAKQRAKAAEEELAEYRRREEEGRSHSPCSDTSSTTPASSPPLKPLSDAPPADLPDVRPRSKPELLVVDSKEKRSEKTDDKGVRCALEGQSAADADGSEGAGRVLARAR